MTATTYSRRYWELLIGGYEQLGKPVPQEALDGLQASLSSVESRMRDWMVIDNAGREMARIIWAESGMTPWAKQILDPTLQAINLFKNGTTATEGMVPLAAGYLDIKNEFDTAWAKLLVTHKHTQAFVKVMEAMQKTGRKNHSFPREVVKAYCEKRQGWKWTSKMNIGTGTTVHLSPDELPDDCLVTVTGALLTVVGGKLHVPNQVYVDTDVTRGGTRAVYGWWTKP